MYNTNGTIDFAWSGSPATNVPADYFTARVVGFYMAYVSGLYTFSTQATDGGLLSSPLVFVLVCYLVLRVFLVQFDCTLMARFESTNGPRLVRRPRIPLCNCTSWRARLYPS